MKHELKGFTFEMHAAPGNMAAELCHTLDGRRKILCNCNGIITEADITECEDELVEKLYSCHIDGLRRYYDGYICIMSWPPYKHFTFKFECFFDNNYVISAGIDEMPGELFELIPYLRKVGMSFPIKKWKTK